MSETVILTNRYRVKDAQTAKYLAAHARAVNYVWNYLCETQRHAMKWRRQWPSSFDLKKLTAGSSTELNLPALAIEAICDQFVVSRDRIRRCPRFRGRKSSLGWVPFRNAHAALKLGYGFAIFRTRKYRLWMHRLPEGALKNGSFACDARGRWYLNIQLERMVKKDCGKKVVGIDLGLKDLAALSDGTKIENPRHFRRLEEKLAVAQRAGNKKRALAIHAKIANRRKDDLHKLSANLIRQHEAIFVGDVKSAQLKQTSLAKSVSDASWSTFRGMLRYKAIAHGAFFAEVDERYSSQTCSACGSISGPKGRKGLRVRQFECADCGAVHDRDHNAAINILIAGAALRPLSGEITGQLSPQVVTVQD